MPLADRLQLLLPAVLACLLLLLTSLPWQLTSISIAPNIVFMMSLTLAVTHPAAWTPVMAFLLGVLTDALAGTPLASHALIAVLLTILMRTKSRGLEFQPLRVRWILAVLLLAMAHLLLWLMIYWVAGVAASVKTVARAVMVNSLWFPAFYFASAWLGRYLPARA